MTSYTPSTATLTGSNGQVSVYTTAKPVLVPLAQKGLSESDKIALGVGLGVGVPACLAGIVACVIMIRRGG